MARRRGPRRLTTEEAELWGKVVEHAVPMHRTPAEAPASAPSNLTVPEPAPAPAPIARIRGRHRVRLLVKASKSVALQPALAAWVGQLKLPNSLRLSIDIDPQNFY